MKFWTIAIALLYGASLTACRGASSYAPQAGDSPAAATQAAATHDAATPGCTAKPLGVPGKYIGMFAAGTVSGKTFTSVFGQWSLLAYSKPSAAVSSAATPAPKATPATSFLYAGTYTMTKTKQKGCILLVVGQAVDPKANADASNGVFSAAPTLKTTNYRVAIVTLGILSMKITGLSPAGGRGTVTLLTQNLKPYDTATIVLSKRMSAESP
ncbi:MAG TPA: hypothetical protein VK760_11060 [Candidatus Acidoferrales bacterium]|jgi:hypothetical protein|nr:hypothetical protein [Candidatus Acidoferrales bacterium]